MGNTLTSRLIGFAASLLLSLTTFLLVAYPDVLPFDPRALLSIILVLAVIQAMVQSIFFLHVLSEKGPRWNLVVFASTLSIITVIVFFSLWIMKHLDYNMMPH